MLDLSEKEIADHMEQIENMTHSEMASLWRFAPAGHPYFVRESQLYTAFKKRFDGFGGFTPAVSKEIGWESPGCKGTALRS
jgi:hypothetical protein